MTAAVLPSEVIDPDEAPSVAVIESGLFHSVSTDPLLTSMEAMPEPPSIHSPKTNFCPLEGHSNQLADAFIPGVMFLASPPWDGTTKMSPPVAPSSLMSPSMKAMDFPSGDQTGLAICNAGL